MSGEGDSARRAVAWLAGAVGAHYGLGPALKFPSFDEADLQRRRRALIDELARDPIFVRLAQQQEANARAGREWFATEPWQALGEQRLAALLLAGADSEGSAVTFGPNAVWPAASTVAATLVLEAQAYLWHSDLLQVANSAPLPAHTVAPSVLPHPLMFWTFEAANEWRGPDGETADGKANWQLIADFGDGFLMLADRLLEHDGRAATASVIPCACGYGLEWPDERMSAFENESLGQSLRCCAFLTAPFVDSTGDRLPRPIRREVKRQTGEAVDPLVRVVRLRQRAPAGGDAHHVDAATVERKHRWWVNGHYRAQWYPSIEAHKVIYIAPHLKGPEDMPLLQKVYDVVR